MNTKADQRVRTELPLFLNICSLEDPKKLMDFCYLPFPQRKGTLSCTRMLPFFNKTELALASGREQVLPGLAITSCPHGVNRAIESLL